MPDPIPTPTPTPTPTPAPRTQSSINQAWAARITRAETICKITLRPAMLPQLIAQEIAQSFITGLQLKCANARNLQTDALVATSQSQGDTQAEAAAKKKLLAAMQQAQAWARQKFFFTEPARLATYHIGETLDANFDTLMQFSQDIRDRAIADTLPGVDAAWVTAYNALRNDWLGDDTEQADEEATGIEKRALLKALIAEITHDMMTILFAADGIWQHSNKDNAAERKLLTLPPDRPYSPPLEETEVEG